MRILASNPDTLGDLILRQPMYRAWLDAGHELTLIVRPTVAPLVPYVAPGARVLELPHEVYAHDLTENWDRFAKLFDEARAFAPDALVIAPYRWTLFDEHLADELPASVKRFGLSGHLYAGDPHRGSSPASTVRFDVVADVCEDAPEVEKNAALASAVLGEPRKERPYPRIEVPEPNRARATEILSQLGLRPGDFWIACVTGTANVSLKAWHGPNWAKTLSSWARSHGRNFLFVGLTSEADDARAVQHAMKGAAAQTHLWMPPGGTIDDLVGLTSLSAGYVGHDTGPMHVAAALGKPVLAVFGGGHKLRFQPAVEPSVTVTVGVSCRGCQWVCPFAESHCVKAVPVDAVIRAADDLEAGRVSGREARVLEPSEELAARMVRESTRIAQERLRAAAELSRQLELTHGKWNGDVARVRAEAEALVEQQRTAVEHAHAELGGQLREKESMIRRQDEQLREKESLIREQDDQLRSRDSMLAAREEQLCAKEAALHDQHALLQKQSEVLNRTAAEAKQVREHALAAQEENTRLGTELHARANEITRLESEFNAKAQEAAQLAFTVEHQRGELERLHDDLAETRLQIEHSNRAREEATKQQSEELTKLREQMQKIDERLRLIEPAARRPRRPLKQVLVDFVIGPQHYYPPPPKALPGITVVTVTHNDERTVRETVESVIGQTHAHVQYVVVDRGSTDSTLAILSEYRGRIDKMITEPAGVSAINALASGFGLANYDVLARLDPGDVYEPGALTRVAEHFRDHPRHKGAVFDEAVSQDGWRFPVSPPRVPDVYQLLAEAAAATSRAVFVTTNAYKALHGLTRERGAAAEWDLWLRLDRAFRIHRGRGHVRTTRPRRETPPDAQRDADFKLAREVFDVSFGVPGRIRCKLLHWVNRFNDAIRGMRRGRLSFPLLPGGKPLPSGVAPARVPSDQPVCPVNGHMPDRLISGSRDSAHGRDDTISYVYYNESADAALVYPPIDLEKLQAIYNDDSQRSKRLTQPDPAKLSPYAGYRGRHGTIARILSHVRSPYWWFCRPDFGDTSVAEMLATLDGPVPQRGARVRFLNVGCFEGGVLDALKTQTDWTLAGTETNPAATRVAREKGHTVWETSAQDAPLILPADQIFEVIYLAGLLEHVPDPLVVLRRLRQILAPGGRIVLDTPNLDSRLLDLFGPTWSQWQLPYHRTLVGRRGLRKLARRGSFRIERMRTRTHPLAAVKSVMLNELGLGAVVPDTAEFPPDVASRGVLLTGWARLLWDWRGRGDYLYAVLRAE